MLPIQIWMRKWYTDMMVGKLHGIDQLQKSLTEKGTRNQLAYADFLRANRRGILRASLFLTLLSATGLSGGILGGILPAVVGARTMREFIKNKDEYELQIEKRSRKRPRESSQSQSQSNHQVKAKARSRSHSASVSNKHKKN
jgi:hypothetical protein